MPGGAVTEHSTGDVNRVEAPVTLKAYAMCAFAAFGGIFFGYDSGYISGVNNMKVFIHSVEGSSATELSATNKSLIVSILSAGTFFGALIGGDFADWIGRRLTIITGCLIFLVGVALQTAHEKGLGLIVPGRLIAGFGVGFVSAILILVSWAPLPPLAVPGLETNVAGDSTCPRSPPARSVVPLSVVTSSVSPSVCFLPLAWTTVRRK